MVKPRWYRLLLSLDQFFNVLIFNGSEDLTISATVYKRQQWRWVKFIDWLFSKYESDHCRVSWEDENANRL